MPLTHITSKELAQKFVDDHDTFLFDCDGVLWRGSELVPHSKETVDYLRSKGKQVIFVTNNSTKSRKQYVNKFKKLGMDVSFEEIFGSAYSAAVYLDRNVKIDKKSQKVLVLGEEGLEAELHEAGFQTVGGADESLNKSFTTEDEAKLANRDPSIAAVVCGLDTHINYLKLAIGQANLKDPNVPFVATNIDSTFPSAGKVLPGAGTVIKALAYCSEREPDAILGKPAKDMMDCIKEKFPFDPKRAVMVGDRLNTDMVFGQQSGLDTLFVLTGIDTLESAKKTDPQPTLYANKLGDIYELLK